MRGDYSTYLETVDDFILNTHALAKLRRALKNSMNVKTSSNYREFSHGQKERHEQYIQQLLTTISTDPFHDPSRNIMSGLEISSKIIYGLLAAKETGEKLHLEFFKNQVTSHNTSFFETIKKSGRTYKDQKKKTPKVVSVRKEDRQALGFFVSKCRDKKVAFHYPLTSYPLAIANPSGKK